MMASSLSSASPTRESINNNDNDEGMYFPDWADTDTCQKSSNNDNDNSGTVKTPKHMSQNKQEWMTSTLHQCCVRYYSWNYYVCISSSSSSSEQEDVEGEEVEGMIVHTMQAPPGGKTATLYNVEPYSGSGDNNKAVLPPKHTQKAVPPRNLRGYV